MTVRLGGIETSVYKNQIKQTISIKDCVHKSSVKKISLCICECICVCLCEHTPLCTHACARVHAHWKYQLIIVSYPQIVSSL